MSPLGFDFLVEVWNATSALRPHLKRYLGTLPQEAVAALREINRTQMYDEGILIRSRHGLVPG